MNNHGRNFPIAFAELKGIFDKETDKVRDVLDEVYKHRNVELKTKTQDMMNIIQTMSRTRNMLNQIEADKILHIYFLLYYLTLKKIDGKIKVVLKTKQN